MPRPSCLVRRGPVGRFRCANDTIAPHRCRSVTGSIPVGSIEPEAPPPVAEAQAPSVAGNGWAHRPGARHVEARVDVDDDLRPVGLLDVRFIQRARVGVRLDTLDPGAGDLGLRRGLDLAGGVAVPVPPRSLRFTNRATYIAKLGSARSASLKFARRMHTTSITAAGRTISFNGIVKRPLARRAEPVTIRASASCSAIGAGAVVATAHLTSSGTFSTTLQLPASLQSAPAVYLQAQTRVRQNRLSNKTYPPRSR